MKRINRYRSRFTNDNKTYKVKSEIIDNDPYPDEGVNYYPKYRRRFKNTKKQIRSYQRRMYKTWKHNRMNKWKRNES